MTIQRQYQLPNCTLSLEGMSNAVADAERMLRPSLDMLMRFECRFMSPTLSLVGGMDLLQGLIHATNRCTQEMMSGVHHWQTAKGRHPLDQVQLQRREQSGFQLMVPSSLLLSSEGEVQKPADDSNGGPHANKSLQLHLSTLQLFDLVEALDQLIADHQTLPNLVNDLRPLSRRQAAQGEPLVKRAAPLVLGTGGLALATAAFFFVPIPKVSPPPEELLTPPSSPALTPSPSPEAGAASPPTPSTSPPVSPIPSPDSSPSSS